MNKLLNYLLRCFELCGSFCAGFLIILLGVTLIDYLDTNYFFSFLLALGTLHLVIFIQSQVIKGGLFE